MGNNEQAEPEIDWVRFKADDGYRASVERREQEKLDDERRARSGVAVQVVIHLYRPDLKL